MGTSKEQGDGWVEVKDTSCQWGLTRGGEVQRDQSQTPLLYRYVTKHLSLYYSNILMLNPRLRFALTTCMYCTPSGKKEGKKLLLIVDTNVNKTLKKEGQQ